MMKILYEIFVGAYLFRPNVYHPQGVLSEKVGKVCMLRTVAFLPLRVHNGPLFFWKSGLDIIECLFHFHLRFKNWLQKKKKKKKKTVSRICTKVYWLEGKTENLDWICVANLVCLWCSSVVFVCGFAIGRQSKFQSVSKFFLSTPRQGCHQPKSSAC